QVEQTLPDCYGFRSGPRGTHTSRTLMLAELRSLLDARPATATREDYRTAILDDNALGKKTATTRRLTDQRLSELYALNLKVALFRLLRFFWNLGQEGRPLLALLCASARDPLLRLTAGPVLEAKPGDAVTASVLATAVGDAYPDRFNDSTRNKIARNAASSWTQSGHLAGHRGKKRTRPVATPANAAYALALGYLAGVRGQLLLTTFWARLLDRPTGEIAELAGQASRRGWINYRQAGSVIEVRFPELLTAEEQEALRGED
ncbi:MAG TPA: hypothetical protein VEL76_18555, partial [Gemmataceae bacterium]|nr:hypothetical protein [Gemmataceae bacterium]